MTTTNIEWADRVWNPVTGCTKVSAGCKHCYAEGVANRFWATQYPNVGMNASSGSVAKTGHKVDYTLPRRFTDVMTHEDRLTEPLHWRKPRRVFVNSMSDLFHEDVPDEFLDKVFAVMALCPQHTFIVLTKRPERMREFMVRNPTVSAALASLAYAPTDVVVKAMNKAADFNAVSGRPGFVEPWPLPNVHLGVSCEDQAAADARIPLLLQTPAAVRVVSLEPLLGPIDISAWLRAADCDHDGEFCEDVECRGETWLDHVIVGGESGPGARTCDVEWVRAIVRQCKGADVPVFVKQLGAVPLVPAARLRHWEWGGAIRSEREAKFEDYQPSHTGDRTWRVVLDSRKGGDPSEWPADLRVRELPR